MLLMLPAPVLSQPQNHFWIRRSTCLKLLSCMSVVPMVSVLWLDDLLITAVKTLSGETTSNGYNNNSLNSNLLMQLRAIFMLVEIFLLWELMTKIASTIIFFLKCWWFFYIKWPGPNVCTWHCTLFGGSTVFWLKGPHVSTIPVPRHGNISAYA